MSSAVPSSASCSSSAPVPRSVDRMHLAQAGEDVLVVDNAAWHPARRDRCGVVRNNYFQPR